MPPTVLTIGHSSHPFEEFLYLLRRHEASAVADVRSAPYSRYAPQFNRETLARSLREYGIRYVFLGRELGARSEDPSCYDENGRVSYERLRDSAPFRKGIERVMRAANKQRTALMCAEKEPLDCHRTILVAPVLREKGVRVRHIWADGSLEDHEDSMERLADNLRQPRKGLFETQSEWIERALKKQARRIAYVRRE